MCNSFRFIHLKVLYDLLFFVSLFILPVLNLRFFYTIQLLNIKEKGCASKHLTLNLSHPFIFILEIPLYVDLLKRNTKLSIKHLYIAF